MIHGMPVLIRSRKYLVQLTLSLLENSIKCVHHIHIILVAITVVEDESKIL